MSYLSGGAHAQVAKNYEWLGGRDATGRNEPEKSSQMGTF